MFKQARLVLVAVLALYPFAAAFSQNPSVNFVLNGACFSGSLSPGVLASVFGSNFGNTTAGVSAIVGNKTAAVLTVQPTMINIQIPIDVPTGMQPITVARGGQVSPALGIPLEAYAPCIFVTNSGIFSNDPNAVGDGVFLGSDSVMISRNRPALPGELISVQAVGLGATNPPVGTGVLAPSNPAATTVTIPQLTVAGQQVQASISILSPGTVGVYSVYFTVPAALAEGVYQARLSIGGKQSNLVNLPVGKLLPVISSIVNAASYGSAGTAAPNSIVSIYGVNFGSKVKLEGFPATEFEGVSVTFNGTPAPLFHLIGSANQINLLTPSELPESGNVTVQVKTALGASPSFTLKMAPAVPGIFWIPDPTNAARRNTAALFANTAWRVMPQSQARAFGWPDNCAGLSAAADCGQPARPGDNIQIYVTGLGRATPGGASGGSVLPTGQVAPASGDPLYLTVQNPTVKVGDFDVQLQFSGLAPGSAGQYQVNFQVPPGAPAGDDVPVKITMPGGASDTATIAIRR